MDFMGDNKQCQTLSPDNQMRIRDSWPLVFLVTIEGTLGFFMLFPDKEELSLKSVILFVAGLLLLRLFVKDISDIYRNLHEK